MRQQGRGLLVVTASAFSALALTWGRPVGTSMNIIETRPAITSVKAGGELLSGRRFAHPTKLAELAAS